MAQIPALAAQGLLLTLAREAKKSAVTLDEAIYKLQDQLNTPSFRLGRVLASTSGNGQSASWQQAQMYSAAHTPERMALQIQEYVLIFRDCYTAGFITDESDPETDAWAMIEKDPGDRLQRVTTMRQDVTGLRILSAYGPNN